MGRERGGGGGGLKYSPDNPLQTRTNEVFRHAQILCSSKQQKKLKKALQNESMYLRGTSTTQTNIKQVTVS